MLLSQPELSDIDRMKISYAWELLRNEAIKTALYIIFFSMAGKLGEFLICLFISCTLRVFSGGIHMKTNIGCFVMGFVLLCSDILLLPLLPLSETIYMSALWGSVLVICFLSPIASYKRPFKTHERYQLCKKYSLLFSIAWGLFFTFIPVPLELQHCGIWYLIMQAIQLVLQKGYRYFKK